MTPEQCPNCGIKLRPEMWACPNCPMSFPEDDPASRVHPLKQWKYYQFLLPAFFFAGLVYLAFNLGAGLFRLGALNVENTPAEAPVLNSNVHAKPPAVNGANETPVPQFTQAQTVPSANSNRQWRLRGAVYDIVSLKPLSDCAVLLVDERSNRRIETRTDSSGIFRATVPAFADRGYTVQLRQDGYSPVYLFPGTSRVRRIPLEKRRALARDLLTTFTSQPVSLEELDSRTTIADFYLAPRP